MSEMTYRTTMVHDKYCIKYIFFNDTTTTHINTFPYTTLFRSGRDDAAGSRSPRRTAPGPACRRRRSRRARETRSEEHTSELQSRRDLVCRLLLEKKKKEKTKQRNYKKRKAE